MGYTRIPPIEGCTSSPCRYCTNYFINCWASKDKFKEALSTIQGLTMNTGINRPWRSLAQPSLHFRTECCDQWWCRVYYVHHYQASYAQHHSPIISVLECYTDNSYATILAHLLLPLICWILHAFLAHYLVIKCDFLYLLHLHHNMYFTWFNSRRITHWSSIHALSSNLWINWSINDQYAFSYLSLLNVSVKDNFIHLYLNNKWAIL